MQKSVLITGASRGIGAAAARRLSGEGYRVIINYNRSEKAALSLADEIGSYAVKADVSDDREVERMFNIIGEKSGGLYGLVNNAGRACCKVFQDTTKAEFDSMLNLTLGGAFLCIQKALPYMINQKRGRIINVSSIWGITGASCEVAYSAAKAGLIGLTRALALELGPSGINVNCIAPGVIDTDMNKQLSKDDLTVLENETPLMRLGRPEEVAGCVRFLLSEDADFITGQVISPNGGYVTQ